MWFHLLIFNMPLRPFLIDQKPKMKNLTFSFSVSFRLRKLTKRKKGLFSQFWATEKLETENLRFFVFGFRSIRNGLNMPFNKICHIWILMERTLNLLFVTLHWLGLGDRCGVRVRGSLGLGLGWGFWN